MKVSFCIEDVKLNNNNYIQLFIIIDEQKYYLGTLKNYNDFYWVQTKSKKKN